MQEAKQSSFAVIGAGSWGTALASVLAKNNVPVRLWDRDPELLEEITSLNQNKRYLPGIPLPSGILCFSELEEAVNGAEQLLIVLPSHAFRDMILKLKPLWKGQGLLWATKGLDTSGEFLSQVVEKELGCPLYGVLSGPSFAKEVALGLPTLVTIASPNIEYATFLAEQFSTSFFRAYTTQDIIGVQLGGVVKNILAVAAGISDGLQYGANARAALITRGLAEMMRLGDALNVRKETLMGLAGCGDVILTCTDNQSRNRRFGLGLAEGLTEAQSLQRIGQVVEAVYNVEQLCRLARLQDVELPISEQVFRIMKHGVSPKEAVTTLFSRSLKSE